MSPVEEEKKLNLQVTNGCNMRWKPYVVISTPPAKDILPKVLIKEWAVNHRRGRMQSSVISIN